MSGTQRQYAKYLFIAPAVLTVTFLIIYPICYGFMLSVYDTNLMQKWNFVGLDNFTYIFGNKDFVKSLFVSAKFTFIAVLGHFLFGLLFAIFLNKKMKGRIIFRSILMIPWLFPEIVFGALWKWILNPTYGIINYMLMNLGILNEPVSWLGSVEYAFPTLSFVAVWKGFPFLMLMLLAGLQSIPEDLYEAGEIDGCVGAQALWYITLPQLLPVLSVTLILDTVAWFKHFNLVAILTFGGPANSTMLVSNYIYNAAFNNFNYGEASAMSVVVFIICFTLGCVYQVLLKRKD